jgi:AcrR family transcriptional regulator
MVWNWVVAVRMSRAEQVERNRGLVLEAARRIFLARGYAGATVDAIAEEAGFSKGVVYSQFIGKPDLFLALLEQRIAERSAANADVAAHSAGLDGLRALLRLNARRSADDEDWGRLLIEFRIVAARDQELNARYAALHETTIERFAGAIRDILARDGLTTVHPPRMVAELVLALDAGTILERAAGPTQVDTAALEDLVIRLVEPL